MLLRELIERVDEIGLSDDTPVIVRDMDGYTFQIEDVTTDQLGAAEIIIELQEA